MLVYVEELKTYIEEQVDNELTPIKNDYLSKAKGGTVAGAVTMNSTLSVEGAFSAKGISTFSGAATFDGGITTKNGFEVYYSTPFIDFHFGNSTADYTWRMIESASGTMTFQGSTITTGTSTVNGATTLKGTVAVTGAQTNASTIVATGRISSHDTVGQISDRRLKCDIYGISRKQAYERALKITGCYYKMKNDLSRRRLGFVAQQVNDYFPEAVFQDENGYYGVSYQELVPVLFQALKYQDDRMNEMEEILNTPWWKKLFKRNK